MRVRSLRRLRQLPRLPLRRAARLDLQNRLPPAKRRVRHDSIGVVVSEKAALNGYLWCVVAVEEGCVDFDAVHAAAGYAEPEHDPVEGLRVVAAGLPPVVPRACVREDAGFAYGWCWGDQVGCCCEPLVAEAEDLRAECGRDEVWFLLRS